MMLRLMIIFMFILIFMLTLTLVLMADADALKFFNLHEYLVSSISTSEKIHHWKYLNHTFNGGLDLERKLQIGKPVWKVQKR